MLFLLQKKFTLRKDYIKKKIYKKVLRIRRIRNRFFLEQDVKDRRLI